MLHRFDPSSNPYAEELLQLYSMPATRYSREERQALARVIASKLYKLKLTAPYEIDWSFGSWKADERSMERINIDVLFDADLPDLEMQRYEPIRSSLIVLSVGERGVIELFNGAVPSSPDVVKEVKQSLERLDRGDNLTDVARDGLVPYRSDEQAKTLHSPNSSVSNSAAQSGGGGGGDNNGSNGNNGEPPFRRGRGGISEVINHSVLFSAAPEILIGILEEI